MSKKFEERKGPKITMGARNLIDFLLTVTGAIISKIPEREICQIRLTAES
jgi:hypothetical protein